MPSDSIQITSGKDKRNEVVAACGALDVLNADVDALGDDARAHPLVHNDAHGVLRHVEHGTCA